MTLPTSNKLRSGFTIVELLIVIVVIAILAAISIVSYTGIQNRANTTAAGANAESVQKVAETIYADDQLYPNTVTKFTTATTVKLPANVSLILSTAVTPNNVLNTAIGKTTVLYKYTNNQLGACAFSWDFGTNAVSTNIIYMGNATASNCNSTGTSDATNGFRPAA